LIFSGKESAPERTRTSDLLIRSQALYPTELLARQVIGPYYARFQRNY
jgi:hypothetical protein